MASSVTAVTSVIPSAFKKSTAATPSGPNKRKIASVIVDQENMASSPPAATAAVTKTPINNSVVKKVFTGANVAVSALNNQTNIINNQQPKARVSQKSQQIPKSTPIIDPSTAETLPPKTGKAVLPQAVARRNARERNRVKQVNNGFAALRQHIPEEMAEAFEKGAPASGQLNSAAQKKLSKVETLRMAVEYIRNLEGLLNISSGNPVAEHSFSFCNTSSLVSNSPSSPSFSNSSMIDEESLHLPHNSQPQQLLGYEEFPVIDQSRIVLPSVTTINGIPYLSQGFLQPNGEFVVVTGNGQSGDEEEQQQQQLHHHQPPQQFMYQSAGVDPQQQIILYAPLVESDFQSNFVNNNLLAPAFQGAPLPATAAVGAARNSGGGGQSPVPDGDQIKIEQEPSRGGPSPHSYENKSPLIRHVPCDEREESPPKKLCSSNEQFSVVDQSGVIIRGNFIEIKQEQFLQQQQQPQPSPGSDDLLTPTAESMYDNWQDRLVHMKTEIRDDEEAGLGLLESDMMIDAMEWWENEKRSA